MPLFALKSQSRRCALEDAGTDFQAARRSAQFRIGAKAIYFPAFPGTRYLPYQAVTRAVTRNTSLPLTGSCGKALPLTLLRLYYDGGEVYQDFLFEKRDEANRALDALLAARPGVPAERETRPQSAL